MRKALIGAALAAAFVTPSLAAEFYVVQDTATKRCTIVQQKPTVTTSVIVGNGKVYTTREEADTAMKTITVCKSN